MGGGGRETGEIEVGEGGETGERGGGETGEIEVGEGGETGERGGGRRERQV